MGGIDPTRGVTAAELRARGGAKWNKYDADVIGAWVADMDFVAAEPIQEAVRWSAEHSAFGYGQPENVEQLFRACSRWYGERHGWEPDPSAFLAICDIVQGIHVTLATFTEPGDGVIVQGPIYPPFLDGIRAQGRTVVDNRLRDPEGEAALDLDGLRRAAADPRTRLMLLCNPHNPTGRVLTRDELEAIAEIAVANDLTVLSDEIWMDIVYPGHKHIPFAAISPEAAARTITMTSATKSFNLGGIRCAVAHFGSPALQARFERLPGRVRGAPSTLSVRATTAAWTDGGPWFDTVLRQLDANRQALGAFLRTRLPEVRHRTPEGTYVAWLDFTGLNLERNVWEFLLETARVGLNNGVDFGDDDQHVRMNFATTPALLDEALGRIARAVRHP